MPKNMQSMDGNTAAAHVSYAFTDVAAIYPITPSSPMAELIDAWSAKGRKNLFGQSVNVVEMQAESGAAGAVHGSLTAGALTTTYTASQGLLLMIPNMYKISGELLPGVFHVSARAVAGHALSIFGDHTDVMATRQTGFALLASGSVQEVMDLSSVAHLAAIKSSLPFLHFFDGFRTSQEIQKVEVMDYEELRKLLDYKAVDKFRKNALNPEHPRTKGTAQNPDIYFQAKESINRFYTDVPDTVANYMKQISDLTGREYKPFNYYGDPEAEYIIAAMGSVTDTIEETVDYLTSKGEKVGVIKVHLYRPFSEKYFMEALPKTTKKIAALDRTKEIGSIGEPLYEDIRSLFYRRENAPEIVGGRYGLGSKDTTPSQIKAVYDNLKKDKAKDHFTIGIVDDVTNTSLEVKENIQSVPEGTISCKFWGFGSDGTVGANKNAIKIIGDNTDMYAQGYFAYDSKKSGGVTISHLRFGHKPIKSTYFVSDADYVACHKQSYIGQYDMISDLKESGTFVLNTNWDKDELEEKLPADMKRYIANNNIDFYIIDATKIAMEIGLGNRINTVMQAVFFKLAKVIPLDKAEKLLKDAIKKTYGKKGEKIVKMNYEAIDRGFDSLKKIEAPDSWKNAKDTKENKAEDKDLPDFIKKVAEPMNKQKGDSLPVSAFKGREDGSFPSGTTAYEKRGVAIEVPEWKIENCIQCNECAFVCPHAAIRPYLLNKEELNRAPDTFETKKAIGGKKFEGLQYRMQISPLDCTGCGNCVDVCPAPNNALVMKPIEEPKEAESKNWEFAQTVSEKKGLLPLSTVKGSQFSTPLMEFSGACAGCGETPYAKVATQLYGDRMIIANATGCSSIWGGSAPSTPYTVNSEGKGPAWANSLFEDNAEYGFGMVVAVKQIRNRLEDIMKELLELNIDDNAKEAFKEWIEGREDAEKSKTASKKILEIIQKGMDDEKVKELLKEIQDKKDFLVKKSIWSFGGDGWAYDIGYGGLDHVLASGEDINVMVFDTEVYSNTGGQSSKASPTAAVAKFAASGKKSKKKDLGLMLMSYGYVYVAQVAMGANKNQFMKALTEAESHKGPSIIIAYSPCIAHGIKAGMAKTQTREKEAVEAGYWHLYRYNPELKKQGKNPFVLDSKEPSTPFKEFLEGEIRYTALQKTFPEIAEELFAKAEEDTKQRYETYRKLAEGEGVI